MNITARCMNLVHSILSIDAGWVLHLLRCLYTSKPVNISIYCFIWQEIEQPLVLSVTGSPTSESFMISACRIFSQIQSIYRILRTLVLNQCHAVWPVIARFDTCSFRDDSAYCTRPDLAHSCHEDLDIRFAGRFVEVGDYVT